MQRLVPITGTLTPCPGVGCGRQPKHWLDLRGAGQHLLECSPCQNRTPRFASFQEAVEAWESQRVEIIRGK